MSLKLVIVLASALMLGACATGVGTRVDSGGATPREERPSPRPERAPPRSERPSSVPERTQPVPERVQPAPERVQPAPERAQPAPERPKPPVERTQPLAFASTLACGDRSVTVGHVGDTMRMEAGGETFDLRPVRSASGARYEAVGDSSTSFWSKGDRASVVVRGQPWPECVPERAPSLPYRATGNEPGWRLDITAHTIALLADDGRMHVEAPTPVAEPGDGFTRFRAPAAGAGLVATIFDRRCADSMTGMPYPNAVTVAVAGRMLTGCGGDPATLLQGAEWVVEDLRGAGIVDRSRVTLAFAADGRVSGHGSCNRYTASYKLTGEGLTISKAASTRMACAPALMRQERLFFDLLAQVRRFTIDASGALVLHAADGGTIAARRP